MIDADGTVDYAGYSDSDLREALSAIDGKRFPVNFRRLLHELEVRKLAPEPAAAASRKSSRDSLEGLISSSVLSAVVLVYGGYSLYHTGGFDIWTRTGRQHLQGIDALVFFAMLFVALPTSLIRLREWIRDGDGRSETYRVAKSVSLGTCYGYIGYLVLRLFFGGL